jgi:hypothetical protein
MIGVITSSQEILLITLGIPVLLGLVVAAGVLTRPKQ